MNVLDAITNDQLIAETLAWVNEERQRYGRPALDEMPKGLVDHSRECPVARALEDEGNSVISDPLGVAYYLKDRFVRVDYPDAVVFFVRRFDRGEIPEMILAGT